MTESENYSNEEKLLSLVEELQTESEAQLTQIQKLSSEKQELALIVQQQKKKIAEQAERIEMLNESDNELKRSEQKLKESEQRLKESQKREKEAEVLKWNARKKLEEANEIIAKQENIIEAKVESEKERITSVNAQKLKEEATKAKALNSTTTYVLSVYSAVLTLVWLKDHWGVIKTLPEWFTNRIENIKTLWGGILFIYQWGHNLLPNTWAEWVRVALPVVIMATLVGTFGYFILYKALVCRFKALLDNIRSKYRYRGETLLKGSMSVAICVISLFVSVFIVELWASQKMNFVSWWLILSVGINGIYHYRGYKDW